MASRVPINSKFSLCLRSYVIAVAENVRASSADAVMRKASDYSGSGRMGSPDEDLKAKEVFWMRDPKTGNWIPESHFGEGEVDVAELREKLLSKK